MGLFIRCLWYCLWLCCGAWFSVGSVADTCYKYYINNRGTAQRFNTPNDAVQEFLQWQQGLSQYQGGPSGYCTITYTITVNSITDTSFVENVIYDRPAAYNCPASHTSTDYPNQIAKEASQCASPCAAKAGTQFVETFTAGWSRVGAPSTGTAPSPAISDLVGGLQDPTGTVACVNGCTANVGATVPGYSYLSQVPSPSGLYRYAEDKVTTFPPDSNTCTPAANDANNPSAPPKACDGYTGTVGGKIVCVPGAAASAPSGAALAPRLNGNPAAGSDASKALSDPSRSPSNGNGTNTGGPLVAGDGAAFGSLAGTTAGTGAPNGGSAQTGTNGENQDGGECQQNPSAAGCGGAPAAQPTLYTRKTATFADAITAFKTTVQGSAFGTAAGAFLTVSSASGACPTFGGTVPYLNTTITIDQFCSTFATQMLAFIKTALLVVAGFAAFKIAFL